MRLINTNTLEFAEFFGPTAPPYAILSHTWEDEEVSLQEMTGRPPSVLRKKGYRKIVDYCRQVAAKQGFTWAWVDTCCIDKTNLVELTESINSMFRWYQQAAICHVFLSDLPAKAEIEESLPRCRWFTRGWTLQELLAPPSVQFYDQSWTLRGTKANLITKLAAITGILDRVLDGKLPLHSLSIGVRMSWAANRETTRPEDAAYSLLGIFDVNMPMIYGEGGKAFRRLQEEIIRQSNDLTIFAHEPEDEVWSILERGHMRLENKGLPSSPLLALSPRGFEIHSTQNSQGLLRTLGPGNRLKWSELNPEYAITNKGLRIETALVRRPLNGCSWDEGSLYFLALGEIENRAEGEQNDIIGIILDKLAPNVFVRRRAPLHVIPFSEAVAPDLSPSLHLYIGMSDDGFHKSIGWVSRRDVIRVRVGRIPIKSYLAGLPMSEPSANTSHAVVRLRKAIPESHWDHTNQWFFRSLRHPRILAFSSVLTLSGQAVEIICLIHQGENIKMDLFLAAEHPQLRSWFFGRKAAVESTFCEDLPGPGWILGVKQSVDINVGGVWYVCSAKARRGGTGGPQAAATDAGLELSFGISRRRLKTSPPGVDP